MIARIGEFERKRGEGEFVTELPLPSFLVSLPARLVSIYTEKWLGI